MQWKDGVTPLSGRRSFFLESSAVISDVCFTPCSDYTALEESSKELIVGSLSVYAAFKDSECLWSLDDDGFDIGKNDMVKG